MPAAKASEAFAKVLSEVLLPSQQSEMAEEPAKRVVRVSSVFVKGVAIDVAYGGVRVGTCECAGACWGSDISVLFDGASCEAGGWYSVSIKASGGFSCLPKPSSRWSICCGVVVVEPHQ